MVLVMLTVSFSSCSTSQTFTVQGVPGTVITTPQNQQVAVVDNSGQAKIELKRKGGYLHYLQAQTPGSNLMVPFALNYNDNHSRSIQRGTAQSIMLVGGLVELGGALALIGGTSTVSIIMVGGGAAFAGIGFLLGAANNPIDYDYDYQKEQSTNNDIVK